MPTNYTVEIVKKDGTKENVNLSSGSKGVQLLAHLDRQVDKHCAKNSIDWERWNLIGVSN